MPWLAPLVPFVIITLSVTFADTTFCKIIPLSAPPPFVEILLRTILALDVAATILIPQFVVALPIIVRLLSLILISFTELASTPAALDEELFIVMLLPTTL